ncbi:transferrin-binding protein-like solute binding protein [Actinobacillus genomosp. 1]|uniref:transferrin-binding protein-like solute binding protein n=1 Tax=Actinobacillus genomosp. 1 TaxID=254839 RepID=UPI0024417927|nr:transferrin-binding protein-like solute binding protein [Actinobacillus genomosp. 1]WGE35941.1 transferrin-binding protein-like solute binding protein [Actinobacillus genomosp. 1]
MNKHLRLSFIAIACSLAITACSSDNKGATRYEDLVKNKVDEANKKAEEKAKKDKESETAKKLAELEKKQKELEQQLKQKNQEAPKTEPKVDPKVEPRKEDKPKQEKPKEENTNPLTNEQIKAELDKAFSNGSYKSGNARLNGVRVSFNTGINVQEIKENEQQNLNKLVVDGKEITLFSDDFLFDAASNGKEIKTTDIQDNTGGVGKKGGLPTSKYRDNLSAMRYGYYTKDGKTTLFVQGYMSPVDDNGKKTIASAPHSYLGYAMNQANKSVDIRSVPTTGVYAYEGSTFYGKDNIYNEYTTTAYADFANKKVKVEVKDANLTLGGKITGNTFSGNVNGIETKGAFYGTNGVDIGGTFYQTTGEKKGYNGVFGVTQTGCSRFGGQCSEYQNKDVLKNFDVSK